MHGGKSLSGIASPAFRHGRYSKYLPTRLVEQYADSQADPELLALRDEIALLDSRLIDVLKRIDSGESGQLWIQLRAVWGQVQNARRMQDAAAIAEGLTVLGSLIVQGHGDYMVWREIGQLLEQRRKLVESERKRLVDMQQTITAERAMILLAVVTDTIRKHVTDRDTLVAISEDIRRLVAAQPGR